MIARLAHSHFPRVSRRVLARPVGRACTALQVKPVLTSAQVNNARLVNMVPLGNPVKTLPSALCAIPAVLLTPRAKRPVQAVLPVFTVNLQVSLPALSVRLRRINPCPGNPLALPAQANLEQAALHVQLQIKIKQDCRLVSSSSLRLWLWVLPLAPCFCGGAAAPLATSPVPPTIGRKATALPCWRNRCCRSSPSHCVRLLCWTWDGAWSQTWC
jgi:hypothetical protein